MALIAYKANSWYMGHEFKFRFASEHSIDGQYFDMEFQMYFISKNPTNGFNYGVISVLFNRTNYTDEGNNTKAIVPIIDSFFNSLELTDLTDVADLSTVPTSVTAKEVSLGDFLNAINLKRRWIYQGSTTMPPC